MASSTAPLAAAKYKNKQKKYLFIILSST